jgi:hypothetical protein
MRISSHNANAGLTHAFSSFIAVPDSRPPAGCTLALLASAGPTHSYLPLGRPTALSRPIGRATSWAQAAMQTSPHIRDLQESAR